MNNKRFDPDDKLMQSLQTLRDNGGDYPSALLENRRNTYLKSVAGLAGFIPTGMFLKSWKTFLAHTSEGILQTILISAVVVVMASTVYLFREEIGDWFNPEATPTSISISIYQLTRRVEIVPSATPTASATSTSVLPTLKENPTNAGHHYGQTKTPKP